MSAISLTSLPSFADLPSGPAPCLVQQAYAIAVQNAPQDQVFCSGDLIGYQGPSEPPYTVVWSPVMAQVNFEQSFLPQVVIPGEPPMHRHHRHAVTPEPSMTWLLVVAVVVMAVLRRLVVANGESPTTETAERIANK